MICSDCNGRGLLPGDTWAARCHTCTPMHAVAKVLRVRSEMVLRLDDLRVRPKTATRLFNAIVRAFPRVLT